MYTTHSTLHEALHTQPLAQVLDSAWRVRQPRQAEVLFCAVRVKLALASSALQHNACVVSAALAAHRFVQVIGGSRRVKGGDGSCSNERPVSAYIYL
ncbi:hypothetical protein EON65_45160 [archaeon]|nr:MAG: hypothetical protein EON65_45160 [archaeon]